MGMRLVKNSQDRDDQEGRQKDCAHAGRSTNIMVKFWLHRWHALVRRQLAQFAAAFGPEAEGSELDLAIMPATRGSLSNIHLG
jgi:hypothetical protein